MMLPDWREWLFSAKAFAAASLALYLALLLSLQNPYWAMATVYVVAHPLSGATHSKAIYRACGTLIGAAASVALVPAFVETPVLMCLAVSLWVGILLYLALLNPSPSGYIFMLSAYTMPLISLPALLHPEQIFDLALARSEEILLGIACAAFINALVFPRRMGPMLEVRMQQLLDDAASWSGALLAAVEPGADRRHRLVADISALDALIRQMSYDAYDRAQIAHARQLRLRLLMLVPQVSDLIEPLQALRARRAALAGPVASLVSDVSAWMADRSGDPGPAGRLRAQAAALLADCAGNDVDHALARHALLQLEGLLDLWQDCVALHSAYAGSNARVTLRYHLRGVDDRTRHYDYGLMAFSSLSAAAATFIACMLWIISGWTFGSGGVLLVPVTCCFFAALDDPMPALNKFLFWMLVATLTSLLYIFLLLPWVRSYAGLVTVLAPCLLLVAAFTGMPQYNMAVMLFLTQAISDLGLHGRYVANFESFANGSLSAALGLVFVLMWMSITKPFGTEQIAHRLARAGWRDLMRLAAGRAQADGMSRMIDRTAQLLPRVALLKDRPLAQLDAVRDLRVYQRLADLQEQRRQLPPRAAGLVGRSLHAVAVHYRACLDAGTMLELSDTLHRRLSRSAQRLLLERSNPSVDRAAQALVGLYLALLRPRPDAPTGTAAEVAGLLPSTS
ncbi:FUSC family protein [Solimonas soli]|uniref:FUSC family protein n=1 Tax=Solimonas soli TaxID=413479 RepID=UPI0004856D58|nr:FUSC family protein [Solimonas soli]